MKRCVLVLVLAVIPVWAFAQPPQRGGDPIPALSRSLYEKTGDPIFLRMATDPYYASRVATDPELMMRVASYGTSRPANLKTLPPEQPPYQMPISPYSNRARQSKLNNIANLTNRGERLTREETTQIDRSDAAWQAYANSREKSRREMQELQEEVNRVLLSPGGVPVVIKKYSK